MTSQAVELALYKIRNCLVEPNAHEVVGTMGWMFLTALESVTMERDVLPQEMEEWECELWDAMRKQKKVKD